MQLVGRTQALHQLQDHLRSGCSLVTIIGPGGCGKTTLANQLMVEQFVDLTACRSLAEVESAVQKQIGTSNPKQLAGLPGPLVLDNCEQLPTLGETVRTWIQAGAQIVATSRAPLKLREEQLLRLEGLPMPHAVALLQARLALHGAPPLAPDRAAAVVAAVDQLPLAIELCASRIALLGPDVVPRVLDDPLNVGDRTLDRPDRHTSLEKVIRGSWDLLSDATQALLTELSMFAGPFTLDDLGWVSASDPLGGLAELTAASLVRRDHTEFRLYEGVRAFVLRHAPSHDVASQRHRDWVLSQSPTPRHLDDVVAATHRVTSPAPLTTLVLWADKVLERTGPLSLRRELLARAKDAHGGMNAIPTPLQLAHVRCLITCGQLDNAEAELATLSPEPTGAEWYAAMTFLRLNQMRFDEAKAAAVVARDAFAKAGQTERQAKLCLRLATLTYLQRGFAASRKHVDACLGLLSPESDVYPAALHHLAMCHWSDGEWEQAARELERSEAALEALGMLNRLPSVRADRGMVAIVMKDAASAERWLRLATDTKPGDGPTQWAAWFQLLRELARWMSGCVIDVEQTLRPLVLTMQQGPALGSDAISLLFASVVVADRSQARPLRDEARACTDPASAFGPSMTRGLELAEACDHTQDLPVVPPESPIELHALHSLVQIHRIRHQAVARVVIGDGWFQTPGKEPVDLRTRGALRRILSALVALAPGEGLDTNRVFEAGWPDQRVSPQAAVNRVYSAIASLRRLGLEDVLQRHDDGYRLRADSYEVCDTPPPS